MGRFISPDSLNYLEPETLGGLNLYSYCGNNPTNYYDPNGNFPVPALLVILVSALLNGIDGGITAAMNGQDFWKGFAAGAIGGAVGGAISLFTGLGPWATILGRGASTAIYSILNELFQYGSLANLKPEVVAFDVFTDMLYSMLYVGFASDFAEKILNSVGVALFNMLKDAIASVISGVIDGIIDILQTIVFFGNSEQKKEKKKRRYYIWRRMNG